MRLAASVLGVPSEQGTPEAGSSMVKLLARDRLELRLLLRLQFKTPFGPWGEGSRGDKIALPGIKDKSRINPKYDDCGKVKSHPLKKGGNSTTRPARPLKSFGLAEAPDLIF